MTTCLYDICMAWQTNVPGLRNLHDKYFIVHLLHYLSPAFCHDKFQNTFIGNLSSGGQAFFYAETSIVFGSLTRFLRNDVWGIVGPLFLSYVWRFVCIGQVFLRFCTVPCFEGEGGQIMPRGWLQNKLLCSWLSLSAMCHPYVLNLCRHSSLTLRAAVRYTAIDLQVFGFK